MTLSLIKTPKSVPKEKTYQAHIPAGRYAYASTLEEAKKVGMRIGKETESRDRAWNLLYVTVSILKATSSWSYKGTGWKMFVPVRGTGKKRETIVEIIKQREKVAPYKWVKR